MNIADLRAMPECLTANPGIRQGATHRDMQGMAVAPGRDSEAGGGPHSPHMLDCLGNICNRLGVQHCQRVEMVSVPEIPGGELVVLEVEKQRSRSMIMQQLDNKKIVVKLLMKKRLVDGLGESDGRVDLGWILCKIHGIQGSTSPYDTPHSKK
nr:hypothetical protein Iba_chr12fCG3090 [Ipomoea batatas]